MPNVTMWREPLRNSTARVASDTQDQLRDWEKAATSHAGGVYRFTELGMSTRPIVVVGSRDALADFFTEDAIGRIKNDRYSSRDIYMGISPAEHYRDVFGLESGPHTAGDICLRFSYMPGAGMEKFGSGEVGFADIASAVVSRRDVWREFSPAAEAGRFMSYREQQGAMARAIKNNNYVYEFSETLMGSRPLVLLGTPAQLEYFLKSDPGGIENKRSTFANIYMSVLPFVPPKGDYRTITPVNDLIKKNVIRGFGVATGPLVRSKFNRGNGGLVKSEHKDNALLLAKSESGKLARNLQATAARARQFNNLRAPAAPAASNLYCMKFSHANNEPGMQKIGTRKILFKELGAKLSAGIELAPVPGHDDDLV